jgi:hypothetical protein
MLCVNDSTECRLHACTLMYLFACSPDAEGNCFFWAANGKIYPGNTDFGGEPAQPGDRIGILLDLAAEAQCLTAYKNGQRMGMVRLDSDRISTADRTASEGYCWAVTMPTYVTVRVETATSPETLVYA